MYVYVYLYLCICIQTFIWQFHGSKHAGSDSTEIWKLPMSWIYSAIYFCELVLDDINIDIDFMMLSCDYWQKTWCMHVLGE